MQKFARIVEHNDTQILVCSEYADDNRPALRFCWRTTDGNEMEFWLKNSERGLTDEQEEEWMSSSLASEAAEEIAKSIADKIGGLNGANAFLAMSEG